MRRPCREVLWWIHQVEIRLWEVVADAQQRVSREPAGRVGQAVPEVQTGRVASRAVTRECVDRDGPVCSRARDRLGTDLVDQSRSSDLPATPSRAVSTMPVSASVVAPTPTTGALATWSTSTW
jgi:hypothetical protein